MKNPTFTFCKHGYLFAAALFFLALVLQVDKVNAQALVNTSFGWGSGVTGGGSASPVTVSTNSAFRSAVSGDNAKVVQISGTIDLGIATMASIGSNTTIIGLGSDARLLHGGVKISGETNVIIRNVNFEDARDPNWECESPTEGGQPSNCSASNAEYDNLVIQSRSSRVWIDHCTFSNHQTTSLAYDGQLDIKNGSDYVTISYCVFKNGKKTMLVGSSDSDTGSYRVTYAYNWFQGTESRNPRVRFGQVHMLNNYFSNISNYGIGLGHNARVYAERNYFYSSKRPSDVITSTGQIRNVGNKFVSCSPNSFEGQVSSVGWTPSYNYTALNVDDVPAHVQANAGAGKINAGGGNTGGGVLVNGATYRITPRHAQAKSLEVYNFATADGGNVVQYAYWGGAPQKWIATELGNGYWRFSPSNAPGKAIGCSGYVYCKWSKYQHLGILGWRGTAMVPAKCRQRLVSGNIAP